MRTCSTETEFLIRAMKPHLHGTSAHADITLAAILNARYFGDPGEIDAADNFVTDKDGHCDRVAAVIDAATRLHSAFSRVS